MQGEDAILNHGVGSWSCQTLSTLVFHQCLQGAQPKSLVSFILPALFHVFPYRTTMVLTHMQNLPKHSMFSWSWSFFFCGGNSQLGMAAGATRSNTAMSTGATSWLFTTEGPVCVRLQIQQVTRPRKFKCHVWNNYPTREHIRLRGLHTGPSS